MPEERVVLKDEADAAVAGVAMGGVLAIEQNGPGIGEFQAGDDAQKRRLPRSRRSQQRHQFTRWNLQINVVERGKLSELLGDIFGFDAHALCPSSFQAADSAS